MAQKKSKETQSINDILSRNFNKAMFVLCYDITRLRSIINWLYIFVSVPPKKIVITDETGGELTSVVGPFSEGISFTLRCDVFGGK